MTTPPNVRGAVGRVPMERLNLEFPRSLAIFDAYTDAQKAVDYLSDHDFPVENMMIVGTDLKQVERVTGRLTWGKILAGGILSGMWLGLFVGLLMSLVAGGGAWGTILAAVLTGALFGLVWAAIGYSFTRGQRDFTSVSQVVATRYEVLVEHKLYDRGRSMVAQMPGGMSAHLTAPEATTGASTRPNPYEGRYGAMRQDGVAATSAADVADPAGPGNADAASAAERGRRHNSYDGQYGVRRQDAASAPESDDSSAPPNPRD